MFQLIQESYKSIKHSYDSKFNDKFTRMQIISDLSSKFQGKTNYEFSVKCDEENNTPEIVDMQCAVATIYYKLKSQTGISYVHLVFGNKQNIDKVQRMMH